MRMDKALKAKIIEKISVNPRSSDMREILDEIRSLKKMLFEIKKGQAEYDLTEVSLNKARKILNAGDDTIKDYIKRGYLKARRYRDTSGNTRYKIRLSDIRRFQEEQHYKLMREPEPVQYESATEIFERIRNNVVGKLTPARGNKSKKEA